MACCIIAAYLAALLRAKLHQWAVYWGLARRRPGDDQVTVWTRVALAFRGRRELPGASLLPRA
jgi:hypothetical protein